MRKAGLLSLHQAAKVSLMVKNLDASNNLLLQLKLSVALLVDCLTDRMTLRLYNSELVDVCQSYKSHSLLIVEFLLPCDAILNPVATAAAPTQVFLLVVLVCLCTQPAQP